MTVIRFTIIDHHGTTSFTGPCHAIKMLVAACARHPATATELFEYARPYDMAFVDSVRNGLAVFDEHNTPENPQAFRTLTETAPGCDLPPFRVLDDAARAASTEPVGAGLIIFNLQSRRIIQVQNSYADVLRADRGRIRQNGQATRLLYYYTLPTEWCIVP